MIPLIDNLRRPEIPILTVILIAVNCAMFFGWQMKSESPEMQVIKHATIPYEVTHPGTQCAPFVENNEISMRCALERDVEAQSNEQFPGTWRTLFTSMFMHGSLSHLLGNMIFLFAFGMSLELGFGRLMFLLFYLVGGVAADLGHTLFEPSSPVPALGASGAISAVMGGYAFVYPRAKVRTWIIPPLPFTPWLRAAWMIGFLMVFQILQAYIVLSTYGSAGGGVAYFAHFGGFAAGIGLVLLVLNRDEIEELRRSARLASGDEREIAAPVDVIPANQVSPEAAAATPKFAIPGSTATTGAFAPDPFAVNIPPDPFAPPAPQQLPQHPVLPQAPKPSQQQVPPAA